MQAEAASRAFPGGQHGAKPGVLHVIASAGRYGAEVVISALAREQTQIGWRVHVVIISDRVTATAAYAEELQRDAHAHVTVIAGRGPRDFLLAGELARLAQSWGVQIIHSHGYKSDIVCSRIRAPGLTKISTLHGWTNVRAWSKMACYQALQVRALHRFDAVVAVHDSVWGQHAGLASLGLKLTIPNGIATRQDAEACEFEWLPETPLPVVLVVGRLSREKGQSVALDALDILKRRGIDAILVCAGTGPDLDALRQRVAALNLTGRALLPGYVGAIPALMKRATMLLIPSYTEGLPIILLEAMRDGLAVVATAVGGMPAVLGYGSAGRLVAPGSSMQMADAIEAMLGRTDERLAMARVARERFLEHYNVRAMASRYSQIYRDARESCARPLTS